MPEGSKEPSDAKGLWKLLLALFVPLAAIILFFVISDSCAG